MTISGVAQGLLLVVPRAYFWIWAQGPYGVLEINPESAMCKAYALPISLVQIFILFCAISIGTQATIQCQELKLDLCMQSILALY